MGKKETEIMQSAISHCVRRFQTFAKLDNVKAEVVASEQFSSSINRRSEIFLYGIELTLRFQLFYSDIQFQKHLQGIFGNPTPEQTRDFFNELCNLTLGKMKDVLTKNKLSVALSLPVSIQTSLSRVLASQEVLTHTLDWGISRDSEGLFFAKASVEIHKPDSLISYEDREEVNSEGEIEFL